MMEKFVHKGRTIIIRDVTRVVGHTMGQTPYLVQQVYIDDENVTDQMPNCQDSDAQIGYAKQIIDDHIELNGQYSTQVM